MTGLPHLLLLPGLLCDDRLWQPQVDALSEIAEIVIADMTQDDTLASMAARAVDAMPAEFALAGLSMGGYAAFEIMRQAPERVTRLALLDTGARADTPEQTTRRKDLIALADRGEFKAVSPRLLPLFVHESRLDDGPLISDIAAMADSVGKDAFLRQQKAIMNRPDSRPGLSGVNCPTLVLCGRQDVLTPPDLSEEIATLVPGAELTLIDDCGHLSTMERPNAVNAALASWLAA
jgi:pimeloyl-ACP methyl ester carboxylesterase